MGANVVAIVSGLLVVGLAAAAGVAAESGERITICHMPHGDGDGARTLQVSRSSWPGHRGHGDHEGACTDADRRADPPTPRPDPRPTTRLALAHEEPEGEVDGDASFKVVVLNHGAHAASDLVLGGSLGGDGRWSLRNPVPGCSIADHRLSCDLGALPAQSSVSLRLEYDGHVDVCREVVIDLRLTASNDATTGDDRAKQSVHAGACSTLPWSTALAPTALAPTSLASPT